MSREQIAALHTRAAEMRRNPTEPEKRLWRHLSSSQLEGHKFRRQSVIGWSIADFMCPQKALIVEVDGDTHDEAKDRLRDDRLAEFGFRVVRVTNHDVMTNTNGVVQFILIALNEQPDRYPDSPHPNPSPEGEGLEKTGLHSSPSGEETEVGTVNQEPLLGISLKGCVGLWETLC